MKLRFRIIFLFFVGWILLYVSFSNPEEKFKLKQGARGKICLGCHSDFENKLKNPYIHTPVKSGECSGCHNPHSSSHKKMLDTDTKDICFKCHDDIIKGNFRSTHKVVIEGNCIRCHDPHASDNKFNLLKSGNELCFDCHKVIADNVKGFRFKHSPVEKGCLNCHNPHVASNSNFLLKDAVPSLCLKCHKTNTPAFLKQHMNYPVSNAKCTTCHNAHGSDISGILYTTVHKPVADKMCNQCHEEPNSKTPFNTKKDVPELCKGCHSEMFNDTYARKKLHEALNDKESCLVCHTPHASNENKLIKESLSQVCGKCHFNLIDMSGKFKTKHNPVQQSKCAICHMPHSSNNDHLIQKDSIIDLCGSCHDWQKHSTHPIGEKFLDPRDKTRIIDCISCHRAHGTDYKFMLPFPEINDLCTQCHIQLR